MHLNLLVKLRWRHCLQQFEFLSNACGQTISVLLFRPSALLDCQCVWFPLVLFFTVLGIAANFLLLHDCVLGTAAIFTTVVAWTSVLLSVVTRF